MKLTFKDFPRWLNPKLSMKEKKECYDKEIRYIDERAMIRKNPHYWYCISYERDYTKYQWGYKSDF